MPWKKSDPLGDQGVQKSDMRQGLRGINANFSSFYIKSVLILVILFYLVSPCFSEYAPSFQGTESNISVVTWDTDQEMPAIWEDRIVWQDRIDYNYEIILYNSTSGDEVRLTSGGSDEINPDIFQDYIVWEDWSDENYNLILYDSTNTEKTAITSEIHDQVHPSIWGSIIAWEDNRDNPPAIYRYNISTGIERKASENASYASNPDVWGDYIVWEQWFEDNSEIMLFNISNESRERITFDPENQKDPAVWEDRIVWTEYRDGYSQISMYNITNGIETSITSDPWNHMAPAIFGDFIAYESDHEYYDISLIDIRTGEEILLTPDTPDTAQNQPAIWGDRIVWRDARDWYYDIYLCTLGVSMPLLAADFTTNVTDGMPPLTVQFNDLSTGEVSVWMWDFGDGTGSNEQNPVHTYTEPEIYTVTLTVHNPYQRNAVKKEGMITVGSPPSADFSADLVSGPAPLSVQFWDSSAGYPTTWLWDFGDGSVSPDQNPMHTYSDPGIYSIVLTAENKWGNGTIVKNDYITVVEGSTQVNSLPVEGVELGYADTGIHVVLNTTAFNSILFDPFGNTSVITLVPEPGSGLTAIDLFSGDDDGFSQTGNETIEGNLSGIRVESRDCQSFNRNASEGLVWNYNYSAFFPEYPVEGKITSILWEGSTPEDSVQFEDIAINNYHHVKNTAFTLVFQPENIWTTGPATIIFGIDSDWIEKYGWRWSHEITSDPSGATVYIDSKFAGYTPLTINGDLSPGNHTVNLVKSSYYSNSTTIILDDKRDNIQVIRIGDDGEESFVNTTFLYHDPETNMDYFEAYSPGGLSKFAVASVWQEGNVFQLIQMAASRVVVPSGGGGGGGGDDGGAATTTSSTTTSATPAPTVIVAPQATALPTQVPATAYETQPPASTQPEGTAVRGETAAQPAPGQQGNSPLEFFTTGTSSIIILKNLSIIFVAIFVTIVFYYRWKGKEE